MCIKTADQDLHVVTAHHVLGLRGTGFCVRKCTCACKGYGLSHSHLINSSDGLNTADDTVDLARPLDSCVFVTPG